ncbi:GGDEF domain-containing protein [Vibrio agarivorans]|uniref:GGDEF domain-containing protein n=1 Tax=Vibrio agarivorans TaxID=153622 RepID=UPI00222E676B|nr:GGDEF domain-containing protein [Vibrio agarivorans]MDN3659872.1 GGDEF domain-containing protein [Vibrio agarivorans]
MIKGSTLNITKVVLSILIAIVLVVNLKTVDRIDRVNTAFTSRHNEATWFVFQLVKEYSNFLMLTRSNPIDFEQLWLSYDITWSRFDILLNSQESANFIKAANFQSYFNEEFNRLKALEPSIKLVEAQQINANLLSKKVQLTYQDLINFINENFRLQSPIVEQKTKEMNELLLLHRLSLAALSILFIAVIIIFIFESRFRHQVTISDSLTKLHDRSALMRFVKNASHEDENYNLMSLQVRNLDEINQKYGLDYGDIVLVNLADKLSKLVPKGCQSYRFSGRQFIVLGHCKEGEQEKEIIKAIRVEMEKPIEVGSLTFISDVAIKVEQVPKRLILDHLTSLSRDDTR